MFLLVRPFALICQAVLLSTTEEKRSRRLMHKAIGSANSLGLRFPAALAQMELAVLFPDSDGYRAKEAAPAFVQMKALWHLRVLRETPELHEYSELCELSAVGSKAENGESP